MSDITDETSPDLEEVIQSEAPPMSTVPVRLEEAATMWQLPNRRARYDSVVANDSSWVQILDNSRKRSRAVLVAIAQPIRIRTSSSGTGLLWPINEPFPVTHTKEVWVQCATPAQTVEVGVAEEFWAD